MSRSSVATRLIVSTSLIVPITGLIFASFAWYFVSARVHKDAMRAAFREAEEARARLATIDQLTRSQVESSMHLLEDLTRQKGVPSLRGTVEVSGKTVPALSLGKELEVGNFAIVDHIKELAGGTATLFVWDGTNFTRISTNVLKPDGNRALGTVLDPKGKAYAALSSGKSFSGVVDILGVPYITSYTPMRDEKGTLAGALYTGYRLDSIATLGESINKSAILEHGFVALLKPSNNPIFYSKSTTELQVKEVLTHPAGWVIHRELYAPWDYSILTAYPNADVTAELLQSSFILAGVILLMVLLIVSAQYLLLKRLILNPVRNLTQSLENADLNTLLETRRDDEVSMLAQSFNRFVLRLRQTLLQVRDGSVATSGKSAEIRSIGQTTVSGMTLQRQRAEDATKAIEHLSRGIATISDHTLDASRQARAAADAARAGEALVATSATQIQRLSEETQESANRISTLSERAKQIGSIVGVIEEIAAGTNLLALNASIEAARAGEHGRGFAVVAGEVRRLSERTAQATREVADLVSGIETETELTAEGIRTACAHATAGAKAVSSLNSTFDHIARIVIEVDGRVDQIAQAARHEAEATRTVSHTITQVASSASESAKAAEQVLYATNQLQSTASSLEQLVAQFDLQSLPQDAGLVSG